MSIALLVGYSNIVYADEKILEVNLMLMSDIVHELSHAIQFKKALSKDDDLESTLIRISFEHLLLQKSNECSDEKVKEYISSLVSLYELSYDFYSATPAERMANINAVELEKDIICQPVFKASKIAKEYEKLKYLQAQTRDYKLSFESNSPTINFINMRNIAMQISGYNSRLYDKTELISKLKRFSKIMKLEEKLYYGLNINNEEIVKISKEISKNKVYKKRNK